MKKIYHLLPSHTTHLTPGIIRSIIVASKYKHFFLIYLNDPDKKGIYTSLFETINYSNYAFVGNDTSYKDRFRYLLLEIQYPRYHIKHSDKEKKLYGRLLTLRIDNLVIHGELGMYGTGIYKTLLAANIPTVWVCWGNIPTLHRSIIYKFTTYHYKTLFLNRLFCVCALTNNDKDLLMNRFKIHNIQLCPYIQNYLYNHYESEKKKKILVGNSGHYIDSYFEVAELLKSFANLDITFMVPYGIDSDYKRKQYFELKQIAYKYWGDNVHFWENTLPFNEYEQELSKYSVYICNVNRQTGLGAASHCLYYGMKVFLKGTNYNHYKENGYIVHHIKEIEEMNTSDELFNLSEKEETCNRMNYIKIYNQKEQRIEKWEKLFEQLLYKNEKDKKE